MCCNKYIFKSFDLKSVLNPEQQNKNRKVTRIESFSFISCLIILFFCIIRRSDCSVPGLVTVQHRCTAVFPSAQFVSPANAFEFSWRSRGLNPDFNLSTLHIYSCICAAMAQPRFEVVAQSLVHLILSCGDFFSFNLFFLLGDKNKTCVPVSFAGLLLQLLRRHLHKLLDDCVE